jgi:hypothetical protein
MRLKFGDARFGPREKAWAILLIVAGVGVGGYRAVLRPRTEQVQRAQAAYREVENVVIQLEAERPDVDARRAQADALQGQVAGAYRLLEDLEQGLLNRQDLDVLLERVVEEQQRRQIQINAVKPLTDQPGAMDQSSDAEEAAFYKRLLVQVDAYASFDELLAYLEALERQGPYQRVGGVAVKLEGQATLQLRALILLQVLLAETQERVAQRREEIFGVLEQLAARATKDPFLPSEKPKEEEILLDLELTGIFGSGASRTALINGEAYQIGDVIQDKQIVAIHADGVVLERGAKRFLLSAQQGGE